MDHIHVGAILAAADAHASYVATAERRDALEREVMEFEARKRAAKRAARAGMLP